jgi:predicted RNase H-like HicB family nuclease
MVARMKYEVIFEPDEGGGWHAYIPIVRGWRTLGRSLVALRGYIRAALAQCVGVLGEGNDRVARDVSCRAGEASTAKKALAEYRRAKKRAEQLSGLPRRQRTQRRGLRAALSTRRR